MGTSKSANVPPSGEGSPSAATSSITPGAPATYSASCAPRNTASSAVPLALGSVKRNPEPTSVGSPRRATGRTMPARTANRPGVPLARVACTRTLPSSASSASRTRRSRPPPSTGSSTATTASSTPRSAGASRMAALLRASSSVDRNTTAPASLIAGSTELGRWRNVPPSGDGSPTSATVSNCGTAPEASARKMPSTGSPGVPIFGPTMLARKAHWSPAFTDAAPMAVNCPPAAVASFTTATLRAAVPSPAKRPSGPSLATPRNPTAPRADTPTSRTPPSVPPAGDGMPVRITSCRTSLPSGATSSARAPSSSTAPKATCAAALSAIRPSSAANRPPPGASSPTRATASNGPGPQRR